MKNLIIRKDDGGLHVPDYPVIPFIEGDGIGSDISSASRIVMDQAVSVAFEGAKKIEWLELAAGEKGERDTGKRLSQDVLDAIKKHVVAIKGPLATPVGKGIRSLNVTIRQSLDLYACVRPVKHINSVPSPMKNPEGIDMVIFRENTEDLYAGIEWEAESDEAKKVINFLNTNLGTDIISESGIGIKPISRENTRRLVVKAIAHAIENNRSSVTLMHKGNIMKFTEGGFRKWGYETAKQMFGDQIITEQELWDDYGGKRPSGKVIIKDRIADMMFQEVLLRPEEYDVIATTNLNGDYISDALAAQAGGLGMAPGANIGDSCAVFEATHGTAPLLAGKDKANPGSLILSGAMMFDHMGWYEAAELMRSALETAVRRGEVTCDLALQMPGAKEVSCSGFARRVAGYIKRN